MDDKQFDNYYESLKILQNSFFFFHLKFLTLRKRNFKQLSNINNNEQE